MKETISKEILNLVLNLNVILTDTKHTETTNKIRYCIDGGNDYYINIYELAYKCKEWAFNYKNRNYCIDSGRSIGSWCAVVSYKEFDANTELGAILKACQWILDNKDNR